MQDISSIGRFYKNVGFYLEGVWLNIRAVQHLKHYFIWNQLR